VTNGKTRIYDGFMGNYKLEKSWANPNGVSFAENWHMDYENDFDSIYAYEPFVDIKADNIHLANKVIQGMHRNFVRNNAYFDCLFYKGADDFDSERFDVYWTSNPTRRNKVDFQSCLNEQDVKDIKF
jgi:hypothetical protein